MQHADLVIQECAEWSTTYKCEKCGDEFVVSDDSDDVWEDDKGHRCDEPVVILTDHAHDRMKERLGLPKKARERAAERAFLHGKGRVHARGALGRYLDGLWLGHPGSVPYLYGQHVYFFKGNVLITVHEVPKNLRSGIA